MPLSVSWLRTKLNTWRDDRSWDTCILDEDSASDGDIFPHMFRQAGLGPLIGKRSWGGVVGIDAADLRIITTSAGREGRKVYTHQGLFTPDGRPMILGLATWIVVPPEVAAGQA